MEFLRGILLSQLLLAASSRESGATPLDLRAQLDSNLSRYFAIARDRLEHTPSTHAGREILDRTKTNFTLRRKGKLPEFVPFPFHRATFRNISKAPSNAMAREFFNFDFFFFFFHSQRINFLSSLSFLFLFSSTLWSLSTFSTEPDNRWKFYRGIITISCYVSFIIELSANETRSIQSGWKSKFTFDLWASFLYS